MGLNKIQESIDNLSIFWEKQNVKVIGKSMNEIEEYIKDNSIFLPDDFKKLYHKVNGMGDYYPNEIDEEGFLFYPFEAIISAANESSSCSIKNKDKIFIFAEYMHKSWLYGFEVKEDGTYTIGIIPDDETFKPIAQSLAEFLDLYLQDSPELYNY